MSRQMSLRFPGKRAQLQLTSVPAKWPTAFWVFAVGSVSLFKVDDWESKQNSCQARIAPHMWWECVSAFQEKKNSNVFLKTSYKILES